MTKGNLENGVMTKARPKTAAKFNNASSAAVQAEPAWVSFFAEALRLQDLMLSRRAALAVSAENVKETPASEQTTSVTSKEDSRRSVIVDAAAPFGRAQVEGAVPLTIS